ncbi:MAG: sulfide-dependent adenosine diphosphate thiazole synthase [Candidatus Cloacimonetes bacterium]|nr:sulfide-dependent adenosine diphosphate thiazole synthase [Candidatus Cloacimonadota bacterium]
MEKTISTAIVKGFYEKLLNNLEIDTAIVGGGPSGLICAYYLAKAGLKVSVFESKLSFGGGIWGGAMMFNEVVIQKEAFHFLDEFKIRHRKYDDNFYQADSVELASSLVYHSVNAGATLFNNIYVEDVILKENRISGIVINWAPVMERKMHVDPLMITSKNIVDATGHPSFVSATALKKGGITLNTPSGGIEGEKPMWAELGEKLTVEHSKEIFPGLYVSGMAANGVSGSFRMGPIFGGMLLSGYKIANLIIDSIKQGKSDGA